MRRRRVGINGSDRRRSPRRQITKKRETPPAREKRVPPPTGQYLSKAASDLKNDPLYFKTLVPLNDLITIGEEVNHFTSLEGLRQVLDKSYETISEHNNFKESVSKSAYGYYLAVVTWTRVLLLHKGNRYLLTKQERELIDIVVKQYSFCVPELVFHYLAGIGNTTIPSGPDSKFKIKEYHYDQNGYFNQMDTSLYLTTAYPCISIYAQRIMEDVRVTGEANPVFPWQPNQINRDWREQCLGYVPAERLTPRNKLIIQSSGITATEFPSILDTLRINISLMSSVAKYLKQVLTLKLLPIPTDLTGSQGQFVINVPSDTDVVEPDEPSYTANCPFWITGSVSFLGATFMHRVDKNLTVTQSRALFPYAINNPTAAQIASLHHLQTGWSPLFNGIYHFEAVKRRSLIGSVI